MCGEKQGNTAVMRAMTGSPPHVRGKEEIIMDNKYLSRITPACAGKRSNLETINLLAQDHPRMCGEKGASGSNVSGT